MNFVYPENFNPRPTLENDLLSLRPVTQEDYAALAKAASDPGIWAGHPARNRYQEDAFSAYFKVLLDIGGCLLIKDRKNEDVIGCSAFYTDKNAPSRLSIGFTFLTRAYWGGSTNRALKDLMLGHIFQQSSEAWFHIAPENYRSQAATKKLGAVFTHEDDLDLGGGLQKWQCYCLTSEAWNSTMKAHENGQL